MPLSILQLECMAHLCYHLINTTIFTTTTAAIATASTATFTTTSAAMGAVTNAVTSRLQRMHMLLAYRAGTTALQQLLPDTRLASLGGDLREMPVGFGTAV